MLSLRIQIDDDLASPLLAPLLRRAGHDATLPSFIGIAGENDPVHLRRAIMDHRILLSANHDDFEELHELIITAGGHRPGIFVVRRHNDKKRDLKPQGIVAAIGKLCASESPLSDTLHILNHWR